MPTCSTIGLSLPSFNRRLSLTPRLLVGATKSLNTRLSYTLPRFSFAFIHSRVEPGNDTTVLYHSGSISYHVSPEVLLSVESEVGVDTIDHDLVVHTLAGEPLTCRDKPKHLPVSQCLKRRKKKRPLCQ